MTRSMKTKLVFGMIALALAGAADAKKKKAPPPPPPPPPPPVVVVIPPRPLPPLNASKLLTIAPVGPDGARRTINYAITPAQTVWNFRSAYNVAALDCLRPEHAEILTGYKKFLKTNAKALAATNRAVDREYKARFGLKFIRPREAYMTQVYNFYAMPPTVPQFCDAVLTMSRQSLTVLPKDVASFSAAQLPLLDNVFEQFFRAYDQWHTDAALWDARYAPTPTAPALPPAFATPAATVTLTAPGAAVTAAPAAATAPPATVVTLPALVPAAQPTPAPTASSTMGPKLPGT